MYVKMGLKEVLRQYPFQDPFVELIRHNENMTYKVTEKESGESYLLRMHKPISKNMEGIQNTREAILSEMAFLLAWSAQSELPVQLPVPSLQGEFVTTVDLGREEVPCSVLTWITGDTLSKQEANNEDTIGALGSRIASLHLFSQSYQPGASLIRPAYGIEWAETMLDQLREGETMGVISADEFDLLEQTFALIIDRMNGWHKTVETWGFIHADITNSNLIRSPRGISFIDFGLSGHGYYAMDVAMGALLAKGETRDALLSGYAGRISGGMDRKQLEALMFLAISGYYAFLISQPDKHNWIREHISGLVEHLCKPFLEDQTVFYRI